MSIEGKGNIPRGHVLEDSIDQLGAMIEGAQHMAEAGQMVELDVLAMKIAVLTDAINDRNTAEKPNPLVPKLEPLVAALDRLEIALRTRNVNLTLDLQQADRRLRAQVAYRGDKPGN